MIWIAGLPSFPLNGKRSRPGEFFLSLTSKSRVNSVVSLQTDWCEQTAAVKQVYIESTGKLVTTAHRNTECSMTEFDLALKPEQKTSLVYLCRGNLELKDRLTLTGL